MVGEQQGSLVQRQLHQCVRTSGRLLRVHVKGVPPIGVLQQQWVEHYIGTMDQGGATRLETESHVPRRASRRGDRLDARQNDVSRIEELKPISHRVESMKGDLDEERICPSRCIGRGPERPFVAADQVARIGEDGGGLWSRACPQCGPGARAT